MKPNQKISYAQTTGSSLIIRGCEIARMYAASQSGRQGEYSLAIHHVLYADDEGQRQHDQVAGQDHCGAQFADLWGH